MLKLYNSDRQFIAYLHNYKDFYIEGDLSTGDKALSFVSLGRNTLIKNECFILADGSFFTIKELKPGAEETEVHGQLDLEDLEAEVFDRFTAEECTITEAANLALAGTGWRVSTDITKRRSVQTFRARPRELLEKIRDAFMCEIRYDNVQKIVTFEEEFGSYKGVYLRKDLNLRKLDTTIDSYDYYTRILPVGKDGLTIESVNGGVKYLENYQYSNKVKVFVWEDTSYEDAETLKEDAEAKLSDMSKPKTSYSADIIDLAARSHDYDLLSFSLGDAVDLVDQPSGIKDRQRIVKMTVYPDEPEKNKCELSNTVLTFEELQEKLDKAADAWEEATNSDGSIKGVYVHGVQADDVVGIEVVVNDSIDTSEKVNSIKVTADGAASTAEAAQTTADGAVTEINAVKTRVGTLETTSLTATEAAITYATITSLNATDATIHDLSADYADFKTATAGEFTADRARIGELEVTALTADTADLRYANITLANIDTANISKAKIKDLFVEVGLIRDAVITDAKITGYLDAVNVNAANITAGTLSTDRLVIRGTTGSIVYELNNITGAIQSVNVDTLNGEILTPRTVNADRIIAGSITANEIAAETITADKINVADLFAQDITATGAIRGATIETTSGNIGGWEIGQEALTRTYSIDLGSDWYFDVNTGMGSKAYNGNDLVFWSGFSSYRYDGETEIDPETGEPVEEAIEPDPALEALYKKFYVTRSGLLHAENAEISGTINATLGSIGGWDIAENTISSAAVVYIDEEETKITTRLLNTGGSASTGQRSITILDEAPTYSFKPSVSSPYYVKYSSESVSGTSLLHNHVSADAPSWSIKVRVVPESTYTGGYKITATVPCYTTDPWVTANPAQKTYSFTRNISSHSGEKATIIRMTAAQKYPRMAEVAVEFDSPVKNEYITVEVGICDYMQTTTHFYCGLKTYGFSTDAVAPDGLDASYILSIQHATNSGTETPFYVDQLGSLNASGLMIKGASLLDIFYPIGSIYMSTESTSPATLMGGTWERIKDRFLLAAGDTYTAGGTGGAATVKLTAAQSGVPAHGHGFTQPTIGAGTSHSHGMSSSGHNFIGFNSSEIDGGGIGEVQVSKGTGSYYVPYSSKSNVNFINNGSTSSESAHKHTATGGAVSNNTASDASSAHNNMPPYLTVYAWKRTA